MSRLYQSFFFRGKRRWFSNATPTRERDFDMYDSFDEEELVPLKAASVKMIM